MCSDKPTRRGKICLRGKTLWVKNDSQEQTNSEWAGYAIGSSLGHAQQPGVSMDFIRPLARGRAETGGREALSKNDAMLTRLAARECFRGGARGGARVFAVVAVVLACCFVSVPALAQPTRNDTGGFGRLHSAPAPARTISDGALAVTRGGPTTRAARARHLVVVNSVGRVSTMHHVAHSLGAFAGWECLTMVWGSDAARFKRELASAAAPRRCRLHVWRGARWGQFLALLTSAAISSYEHIALLLDDLFVPSSGPFAVNVPALLTTMREHKLGGISPAVMGAHVKPMLPLKTGCVRRVLAIEAFFVIYTRAAWQCMARLFKPSNLGGCGYDFCFAKMCSHHRLAVDDRSAVHHLEKAYPERWVMRKLSPADRASLERSTNLSTVLLGSDVKPPPARRDRIAHTDNPCSDSDFEGTARAYSCNYSAAFVDYEPTDPQWLLACG
ncbi:hypothetical protein T492DRAFT_849201 [Pavlovales sp. CCMP2436]|nr:hypothetical protein T492DRAFT_849201 [Pavlovales sp. CCMP2436]